MSIDRVSPPNAVTPRGPYSPAVRAGGFIYVSGQGPIDPATDKLVAGGIKEQTRQTLMNIRTILEGCGATMADAVRCGVFLKDGADFPLMNEVYAEFFGQNKPARTTIACSFHSTDMRVEIDCVAYKP